MKCFAGLFGKSRVEKRQMHYDSCANADFGVEFQSSAMFADDEVGNVEPKSTAA